MDGDSSGRDLPQEEHDNDSTRQLLRGIEESPSKSSSTRSVFRKSSSSLLSDQGPTSTISVSKTLNALLSVASNRICADCRSQLVDSSQVFASFSPACLDVVPATPRRGLIGTFKFNHEAFAPPSSKKKKVDSKNDHSADPAVTATRMIGGHGVFICRACAKAHQLMGESVTKVQSVSDLSIWTADQAKFLTLAGGNTRSWKVYEAFAPVLWQERRPSYKSSLADRLAFCHAKYDAIAFLLPLGGTTAKEAWRRILERNEYMKKWGNDSMYNYDMLAVEHFSRMEQKTEAPTHSDGLPNRLVDFFCVIGHSERLFSTEDQNRLHSMKSPEGLALGSRVVDCYPEPGNYSDTEFPEHVSTFVFPDGCRASEMQRPPIFFTFVLTGSDGNRLYGGALHIYDETMETTDLSSVLASSGYTGPLPWWLATQQSESPQGSVGSPKSRAPSDIIYLPKALVLISHYPFFNLWRHFLTQIYRITLAQAPLPIERYIANFVREVPLPPQGRAEVKFGLSSEATVTISRPAPNELPLVNFSYQPLFGCLSVGNIMVLVGCLLQETKVAICSMRTSLLTPVAEALLTLLFPFEWQGIYIPVMPYKMLDVLDAPVPFLVGLHARYLTSVKAARRPVGVVFVDLDNDIVHLGTEEEDKFNPVHTPAQVPDLPDKDAAKLRAKLEEFGNSVYLAPSRRLKGTITSGHGEILLNSSRPSYARMTALEFTSTRSPRAKVLAEADKAFRENEMLIPIMGFVSEQGQLSERGVEKRSSKPKGRKSLRLLSRLGSTTAGTSSKSIVGHDSTFYIHDESQQGKFSQTEIRAAFLRFFVAIFNHYDRFIGKNGQDFQKEAFLSDLNITSGNRTFLLKVLDTQMFQRFVQERFDNCGSDAEILFFDESIVAKNNRSMKQTITKGGKKETPFLNDESWRLKDSFTPPLPSNWGLPDDGRNYHYGKFPKLDPTLFGKTRSVKEWPKEWDTTGIKRREVKWSSFRKRRELMLRSAMRFEAVPTLLTKTISHGKKNVEWAVNVLSRASTTRGNSTSSSSWSDHIDADSKANAQDLILASRRKQCVLVGEIVKTQAVARGFLTRRWRLRYKQALTLVRGSVAATKLESFDSHISSSVTAIQRTVRAYQARRKIAVFLFYIVKFQAVCRRTLARIRVARLSAAVLLQRWWRGEYVRLLQTLRRWSTIRMQCRFRQRRTRFGFLLIRNATCKMQGAIRGFLDRKRVHRLLCARDSRYRAQIVILWQRASTPLSYRAQIWSYFGRESFLGYRMLIDELERLWTELDFKFPGPDGRGTNDDILAESQKLGLSTRHEWKFLRVKEMTESVQEAAHGTVISREISNTKAARERLHAEKIQFYDRLDSSVEPERLQKIYKLFGIGLNEKKKKARLLEILWSSEERADSSSEATLLLFPELLHEPAIQKVSPSKKSLKRGSKDKAKEFLPLKKELWVERNWQKLKQANVTAVALAGLGKIPELTAKLSTAEAKKNAEFKRWQNALMEVHGFSSWPKCRQAVMSSYYSLNSGKSLVRL